MCGCVDSRLINLGLSGTIYLLRLIFFLEGSKIKMNKLIAVYGTLRKGGSNHRVLGGSVFIKTQRISGFIMYGANSFPAVIKGSNNDLITVEIYRVINSKILTELDFLEGFDRKNPKSLDNFYTIQEFQISDFDENIEIYTFDHRPKMVYNLGPQIMDGDWCQRPKR